MQKEQIQTLKNISKDDLQKERQEIKSLMDCFKDYLAKNEVKQDEKEFLELFFKFVEKHDEKESLEVRTYIQPKDSQERIFRKYYNLSGYFYISFSDLSYLWNITINNEHYKSGSASVSSIVSLSINNTEFLKEKIKFQGSKNIKKAFDYLENVNAIWNLEFMNKG